MWNTHLILKNGNSIIIENELYLRRMNMSELSDLLIDVVVVV